MVNYNFDLVLLIEIETAIGPIPDSCFKMVKSRKLVLTHPCVSCKKNCDDESIKCNSCSQWTHAACISSKSTLQKKLSANRVSFLCRACAFDGDVYIVNYVTKLKQTNLVVKTGGTLSKQVSNISQKSHGIKILVSDNDEIITDDHNKANALNKFFASQTYIDELHATLPDLPNYENAPDIPTLDRIVLTERNVEDILKTLDTSKAMGPDLINARILKEASRELSIPLLYVIQYFSPI